MTESKSSAPVNAKMGLAGWLTLVFVILKLNPGGYLDSAVQDWSWWLVFSPILIVWGILLGILIIATVVGGGILGIAKILDRRDAKRRKQKIEENRARLAASRAALNRTPTRRF